MSSSVSSCYCYKPWPSWTWVGLVLVSKTNGKFIHLSPQMWVNSSYNLTYNLTYNCLHFCSVQCNYLKKTLYLFSINSLTTIWANLKTLRLSLEPSAPSSARPITPTSSNSHSGIQNQNNRNKQILCFKIWK